LRYDDPQLRISWPLPVVSLSDKDRTLPLLPLTRENHPF
jgi:dTDP-4-dehydrorhamnose 3,5-epimerase-like enzyme